MQWVLVLCLIMIPLPVEALSAGEIPSALQKIRTSIRTLQADFEYSITPTTEEGYEITHRGSFTQKGSTRIKIEFDPPHSQVTLIRDNLAIAAIPEGNIRNQRHLDPLTQRSISPSLPTLLQPLALLEDVHLRVEGRQGKNWMVTGIPKNPRAPFGRVQLLVDAQNALPLRLAIYNREGRLRRISHYRYEQVAMVDVPVEISSIFPGEKGATVMEVRFSNLRVNMEIPEEEFVIPF